MTQNPHHCPQCDRPGVWRNGVGFEHEMRCTQCKIVWCPGEIAVDPGAHYRREYRGVKLDPYRIGMVYEVAHPIAFHMLKKLLRGTSKGHAEAELVAELKDCVRRWEEMLSEDA